MPRTPCLLASVLLVALGPWARAADGPRVPPARRVTLHADKMPLSKALAELTRQTGIRVEDRRDGPDVEVSVDVNQATFWEALDRIADAAKARVDLYPAAGRIALRPRPARYEPRISYDGPFRCAVKKVTASRDLESGSGTCKVFLEVAWEPDRQLFLLETRPQSVVLKDDKGQTVPVPDEGNATAFVDGQIALVFDVSLRAFPRAAQKIGLFEGRLSAVGPSKMLTFTFDSLAELAKAKAEAPERRRVREGVTCTVRKVTLEQGRWTVQVAVDYPPGNKQLDSHQSWVVNNEMVLASRDGARRLPSSTHAVISASSRRAVISYNFKDAGRLKLGRPEDWKLLYRTPASVVEMPIRFSFKDIPLP